MLKQAKALFAAGKLNESLSYYDKAILADPSNYLSLYMRASVYLSQGKINSAIADLSSALLLKSEFIQALLLRSKLYLKVGQFEDAEIDLKNYLDSSKSVNSTETEEAKKLVQQIEDARNAFSSAKTAFAMKKTAFALEKLSLVFESCPNFAAARTLSYEILLESGNKVDAMADLSRLILLTNDSDGNLNYKLAQLHLESGNQSQGVSHLASCLHINPENTTCFKLFKAIKNINKKLETSKSSIVSLTELTSEISSKYDVEFPNKFSSLFSHQKHQIKYFLCQLYVKSAKSKTEDASLLRNATENCSSAKEAFKDDSETLLELHLLMAECHSLESDYESSLQEVEAALKINPNSTKASQAKQKYKLDIKRSHQRDYYKILGVSKTASKSEIKKAFRRLAQQWHPDKHQENPTMAQKKMSDINLAYEVLSDDEKRRNYDNGFDPNSTHDQQQQQYGGFDQANMEEILRMFTQQQQRYGGKQQHRYQQNRQHQQQYGYDNGGGFQFHFDL